MIEVKFRAWDKIEKKMWEPAVYKGELYASSPFGGFVIMDGELKDPLIQFTTLQDVDGVDVWQGDVLEHEYDSMILKWVVGHNGFAFTVTNIGLSESYEIIVDEPLFFNSRRVIGNIHQNPELIK